MDLVLVLTRDCNLACPYCYAGDKVGQRLDAGLAGRALDWAFARLAPDDEMRLAFFGGEPLLEIDLLFRLWAEAGARARRLGRRLRGSVTSNGSLLDETRVEALSEAGIVVGVSIDGDQASHDAQRPRRGGGGSWAAATAGYRRLLRRQPLAEALMVVTPASVARMDAGVGSLIDLGARVIGLNLDIRASWTAADLAIYHQQLDRVGERWLAALRSGRDVWIGPLDAQVRVRLQEGRRDCLGCAAGLDELALGVSGTWYPCERMVGDDGPAEAAWALGRCQDSADGGPDAARVAAWMAASRAMDPACLDCGLRDRCRNGCACSNLAFTGSPGRAGEATCLSQQADIAVADRCAGALWAEGQTTFLQRHYRYLGG